MAASVLYFGPDECNRVQVLESAGYIVHACHGLEDLESTLKVPPQPAAVVVSGSEPAYTRPAVEIVHARAALAPLIIFPSRNEPAIEKTADLVIPPLTPPEEWLGKMAVLIERSLALKEDAIAIQEQSATLRDQLNFTRTESAAARARSIRLRARSAQRRMRSQASDAAMPEKPEE